VIWVVTIGDSRAERIPEGPSEKTGEGRDELAAKPRSRYSAGAHEAESCADAVVCANSRGIVESRLRIATNRLASFSCDGNENDR
jgi:hypothetical protein